MNLKLFTNPIFTYWTQRHLEKQVFCNYQRNYAILFQKLCNFNKPIRLSKGCENFTQYHRNYVLMIPFLDKYIMKSNYLSLSYTCKKLDTINIYKPSQLFLPYTCRTLNFSFDSRRPRENAQPKVKSVEEELDSDTNEDERKLSLYQKFKLMYKQYWYVLIPVHVVTSIFWYGGFFFAAKSGFDIVPFLEKIGTSERFLYYLRDNDAGYFGIAYALYKIATPARYTVTLGGTTISINYLKNRGYIKPVPTKSELKEMYNDKKEEMIERREEMKEKYLGKREELKEKYHEKKDEIIDKYHDKTDEIKEKYEEKKQEFLDKLKDKSNNDKNR